MALVPIGGGQQTDPLYRQALAQRLMLDAGAQLAGALGQQRDREAQDRERQALARMLGGTPAQQGTGLSGGTAGLDPALAGPALAMTGGGMAKAPTPGFLETGKLTPEMAQAFTQQGGDPRALLAMMPQAQEQPKLQHVDWLEGDQRRYGTFNPATGQVTPLEGAAGPAFRPPDEVNVGVKLPEAESAFERERGTASGQRVFTAIPERQGALHQDLARTRAMKQLIDETDLQTGFTAEVAARLREYGFEGVGSGSGSFETFRALANQDVLGLMDQMPGSPSDRDLAVVQQATVSARTPKEAARAQLELRDQLLKREQNLLRMEQEYINTNRSMVGFDQAAQQYIDQNPLVIPEGLTAAPANGGGQPGGGGQAGETAEDILRKYGL